MTKISQDINYPKALFPKSFNTTMAEDMERETIKVTELVDFIESNRKASTVHTKIHKNHQDLYDSGFIEGWNFALDKIIKHLLKI